jgi:hypothetical protein
VEIDMRIEEVLLHRTDLSSFIVHLTREYRGHSAEDNLKSILERRVIEARSAHGHEVGTLEQQGVRAVCMTETPLQYLPLLAQPIEGRGVQMTQWGVAFPKYTGRLKGANPILYSHAFPNADGGSHQPSNALRALDRLLLAGEINDEPLPNSLRLAAETLLAFSSKMQRGGRANEWWWEREWRKVGDLDFRYAELAFGLAPRNRVLEMERWAEDTLGHRIGFLSPSWTLEETIGHLADLAEDRPPWPRGRYT